MFEVKRLGMRIRHQTEFWEGEEVLSNLVDDEPIMRRPSRS
jgi:hypothetical protein